MRLYNPTKDKIRIPLQSWKWGDGSRGFIDLALPYDPGEWTEEIDPEDPLVKRLLESGLTPVVMPTWWERLMREPEF